MPGTREREAFNENTEQAGSIESGDDASVGKLEPPAPGR